MRLSCQVLVFTLSLNVLACYGREKLGLEEAEIALKKEELLPSRMVCGKFIRDGPKIFGGHPAKLGNYPWMAAIGYSNSLTATWVKFRCAGSLITDKHVITAAHCVRPNLLNGFILRIVRLGELDHNASVVDGATPLDFAVEKSVDHDQYNKNTRVNDIGIITLKKKVTFTEAIRPICLPLAADFRTNMFIGDFPDVAGWGSTTDKIEKKINTRNTKLYAAPVEIKDLEMCRKSVTSKEKHFIINESIICASGENTDSCNGDSGGPLMYYMSHNMYLLGIVSYGSICDDPSYPGIYTRVSHQIPWIIKHLDL